jgi:hypothetical protein
VSQPAQVRLAWFVWAFCAGLALLMVGLAIANFSISEPGAAFSALSLSVPMLAYPTVGALVISRAHNRIGWVFAATGVALALSWSGDAYANYALLERPGSLPGAVPFELVSNTGQVAGISMLGAVLLLFPSGKLPAPHWRRALWALIAAGMAGVLSYGLLLERFDDPYASFRNPIAIHGANGPGDALSALAWLVCLVGVVAAAVALVMRFRVARGEERLQLQWVVFAGAMLAGVFGVVFPTFFFSVPDSVDSVRGSALTVASAGIPVAAGIAILRYRLYDIDVVINRTLVYGSLTATLAAVYLGSVLLLQLALGPVTSGSSLAVAVSTLAVAALFRPARARIQGVVDRRFYRSKYDAARTLEGFGLRLREQVDLDALGGELRSVVAETMQPAHVSLWLRREPGAP